MLIFRVDEEKALETFLYLIENCEGKSLRNISNIMFLSEVEHFLDWVRPICGDTYVKDSFGPTPQFINKIVHGTYLFSKFAKKIANSISIVNDLDAAEDAQIRIKVLRPIEKNIFSKSDIEALEKYIYLPETEIRNRIFDNRGFQLTDYTQIIDFKLFFEKVYNTKVETIQDIKWSQSHSFPF